jgi:hypothetical protein
VKELTAPKLRATDYVKLVSEALYSLTATTFKNLQCQFVTDSSVGGLSIMVFSLDNLD